MLKRISFILVFILVTSFMSMSVFAGNSGDNADKKDTTDKIKDKSTITSNIENTDKVKEKTTPLITITRPNVNGEKTFNKAYRICGTTDKKNITIELYKKNSDGTYSEFKDNNGDSKWDIDTWFFSIDITLSIGYKNTSSLNSFMIKAYDRTNPEIDPEEYLMSVTLFDASKLLKPETKDLSLEKILKP